MKNKQVKTLALSIALFLGTSSAHAFFNQGVEPKPGSVTSEEYMNETVEPVPTPAAASKQDAEEVRERIRNEVNEKKRQAEDEQRQADLERERVKAEIAEKVRQERLERERIQRQIREKAEAQARAKAEKERQERLAMQRAEREQERKADAELKAIGDNAKKFVAGLDLTAYDDRVQYMRKHNRAVELAGGDTNNSDVKSIKAAGSNAYYLLTIDTIMENGRYLFDNRELAYEWGKKIIGPDLMKNQYNRENYGFGFPDVLGRHMTEILESWPDQIDEAQGYLDLAMKYGTKQLTNSVNYSNLQAYLDWKKEELDEVMAYAKSSTEAEDFSPDKKLGGSAGLADALGSAGELGSKALGGAAEATKKGWNKVKGITDRCWINCD